MPAFWDASAVVPLCVPGLAGRRGRELLKRESPVVWWVTPLEVGSAIARLERAGSLGVGQAQIAWERLNLLRRAWREVQPVPEVRDLAEAQLRIHALHAADALQLAAALIWCNQRPRRRTFVCLDRRLQLAAARAGFEVAEL